MVCKTHKNLPKAQIKKFREARRAKKLGLKPNGVSKRSAPKARKPIRATKTRGRKAKALKPAAAANPTPAATSATGAAA
jgi:hypothetical protein